MPIATENRREVDFVKSFSKKLDGIEDSPNDDGFARATVVHPLKAVLKRNISSNYGLNSLTPKVRKFVEQHAKICQPDAIHVCDGTEKENDDLVKLMVKEGVLEPLPKYQNCWLAKTDPADVARVESKTVIATKNKRDTIPTPANGANGQLGNWISPDDLQKALDQRFPGCMKGRTMYVIPFSMGPVGSPLSKIGIELTDSPYVTASMRIMTRMGENVLNALQDGDFIKCVHSVGQPLPAKKPMINNWACNPQQTIISHIPDKNEIFSFGSGYGGNSLLGKKCFALRIGSILAKREGWLAEHMLILGITNPKGVKRYIAAAFPSACGKTNLAMMTPTLPGYKIECVGDDIAWMKFDSQGRLRAINPENGFFGVAPGTSKSTNPIAMQTIMKNTVFTNVAKTSDGGVYWEGLEKETPSNIKITSWLGEENWSKGSGKPAAHPNSRFCTPAGQCPIIDPAWESSEGGNFLWPGFGENSRVLDWIFRRLEGEDVANVSPIGYIPKFDSFNLNGLKDPVNMEELFSLPKDFWMQEVRDIRKYYEDQVNSDLPKGMIEELSNLEERFSKAT
ncbi:hypothetical protein CHUAL_007316 [Chamberlinius hualienensis]